MDNKIISPCISICKTDPVTGYCYGCARTNEEKKLWKNEKTSNEWKNKKVPEILLSGHHENIAKWRLNQSIATTKKNRPDLWKAWNISKNKQSPC